VHIHESFEKISYIPVRGTENMEPGELCIPLRPPLVEVFKNLPVGVAVVDNKQLAAGQAGAVGPGWGSPVPVVGPLKQNKIKKSKGFALKGYRGREKTFGCSI
jgi:hypothetical protein